FNEVTNRKNHILSNRSIRDATKLRSTIPIPIGGEGRMIEVVDEKGTPVSDLTIALLEPNLASGWFRRERTDSRGACLFAGLPLDKVDVVLDLADAGFVYLLDVDLSNARARPL